MIVYAVIRNMGYEGMSTPDVIFDTLEKAEEYQKQMGWEFEIYKYTLNDKDGWGEQI